MRLPFPERIPMKFAAIFAAILYLVEQLQGTDAYFSICVVLFIITATFAFNMAGGLTSVTGGYVLFYATESAIIGWTVKAFVGEPADSNLLRPNLTASVFLASIVSMAVAVGLSRRFVAKRPFLENMLAPANYRIAALGCAVLGSAILVLSNILPHQEGSLLSALQQIGELLSLAIILGVLDEIRSSGGRRSVNAIVLFAGGLVFCVNGLVAFGKEGMFTPIACYLVAACSLRFRMSLGQLAAVAVLLFLMTTYLVPYSQYGRNLRSTQEEVSLGRFVENATVAIALLSDLNQVREDYASSAQHQIDEGVSGYFKEDEGLFGRLQMIGPDDMLIDATEQGKSQYGLAPIVDVFANLVPHALWPEKPHFLFGNLYAHEIGGLIDDRDSTTGVSFSPSGDAYHMAGWTGVLLLAPAVWFCCFLALDSLCGDTRRSVWGLIYLAYFSHSAPEGLLTGPIDAVTRIAAVLVVIALFCSYVMPFIGNIFLPERNALRTSSQPAPGPV